MRTDRKIVFVLLLLLCRGIFIYFNGDDQTNWSNVKAPQPSKPTSSKAAPFIQTDCSEMAKKI